MSKSKNLAVETKVPNKLFPCLFVEEERITVTVLYLEQTTRENDIFISQDEFINIINTPVYPATNKPNYINYDNLLIKYKDSIGFGPDIYSVIDTHLRIKIKSTFSFKPQSDPRDIIIYLGIADTKEELLITRVEPKPKDENQSNFNLSWVMPIVFRFENEYSNFLNSDFVLFYSRPGYYCNLPLHHMNTVDFYNIELDKFSKKFKKLLSNQTTK